MPAILLSSRFSLAPATIRRRFRLTGCFPGWYVPNDSAYARSVIVGLLPTGTVPLMMQISAQKHSPIECAGRCDMGDAYLIAHEIWIARTAVMDDGKTRVFGLS